MATFLKNHKSVRIIMAIACVVAFSGCFGGEYRAREKIANINLPFTSQAFADRIYDGDSLAVELYLKAGMNPNAEANVTHWLVLPDREMQQWMNGINANQEKWRSYLTDPGFGSVGIGNIVFRSVDLPVLTLAKIKAVAQSEAHTYIYNLLLEAGASRDRVTVIEESLRQEVNATGGAGGSYPELGATDRQSLQREVDRAFDKKVFGGN